MLKGHAAMFGANVMWGLMAPVAKTIFAGALISPLVLTDLRIFGAAALFWLASLTRPREHVPPADMLRLLGAALLGIVFNQGCYLFGVGMTSPADASIITTSMPLWAMLLAAFILKEPITGKKALGVAAGAAGALLLIMSRRGADTSVGSNAMLGNILVVTAQFSYALYLVLYKNFISRYSLVTIMKYMFTFATLCVLPFSWNSLAATQWSSLSAAQTGGICFVVAGATFLSYMLSMVGQKQLRPTVVGMYNYVQPIVACTVAISLGMDSFGTAKAVAIALIFGGVYLVTVSRAARR